MKLETTVWRRLENRVQAARDRVAKQCPNLVAEASANLRELRRLRLFIDELIDEETIRGRDEGGTWRSLGSSKQQAQQRYEAATARRDGRWIPPRRRSRQLDSDHAQP